MRLKNANQSKSNFLSYKTLPVGTDHGEIFNSINSVFKEEFYNLNSSISIEFPQKQVTISNLFCKMHLSHKHHGLLIITSIQSPTRSIDTFM